MHSKKKEETDLIPPVQYQRGFAEFYKLKFFVDKRVLIPRPETEILVDQVIRANPTNVLEIGTGSGCIAVSIAKNLPECKITAVDISKDALTVAKKNAKLQGVQGQLQFIESNLLSFIPAIQNLSSVIPSGAEESLITDSNQREMIEIPPTSHMLRGTSRHARDDKKGNTPIHFDWIVANLPYIPSSRISSLDSSVKDFEPHLALDGGEDGFDLYRKLFIQMIQKNIYPLYFLGEIDITHEEIAKKEAEKFFPRAKVEIKKDLTKRPRFIVIQF